MKKILIIDDDKPIQKLLEIAIKTLGMSPITAYTKQEGVERFIHEEPILVLLDLGLPDANGLSFIDTVREWSAVPIIVISAQHSEGEKILAFDKGADDYVTKPFSTGELLARIRATLRRSGLDEHKNSHETSSILTSGNITINLSSRRVNVNQTEVKCTPKEFELLKLFLLHSDKVLTHTWLLQNVWGKGYEHETHYLRVFINQLRQKIEPNPTQPIRIITETGIGYRFIE